MLCESRKGFHRIVQSSGPQAARLSEGLHWALRQGSGRRSGSEFLQLFRHHHAHKARVAPRRAQRVGRAGDCRRTSIRTSRRVRPSPRCGSWTAVRTARAHGRARCMGCPVLRRRRRHGRVGAHRAIPRASSPSSCCARLRDGRASSDDVRAKGHCM